jgi:hypothetical protein
MKPLAVLILILVPLCSAALAQSSTAQIGGTVRDATGLPIAGAEVKATQTATGAVRAVTTSANGEYTLTSLPIGPYQIEVGKQGFSKYVQSGIILQVDSSPTVDATLQVGAITEQVTVQSDAALVETRSSGVGQVVDAQRVVELPLNGRNATELIFLAGMANVAQNTGSINSIRNYPTVVIAVAGGISNGTTFLLDGANHNDAYNNLNYPLPFPDALQEFKVETSALPAEYGFHSAAAVNAVTKSGSNQFHGDAFEFLRNGDFNARNFFAPKRDTLKRNQFGGTIGGPIRRNRLFFFLGWQDTTQRSEPTQNTAFVPTPDMLNGDFRTIASPLCNGRQINLLASQGFTDNQISPSRFDPAALIIDKRLPVPTDPCGRVQFGLRNNSDENIGTARVDYQKSDRHSIFGRFYVANLDSPSTYDGRNALTLNTDISHSRVRSLALGDTFLIGSDIVSSFRIGSNRAEYPKYADNFGTWKDLGVNASSFLAPTVRLTVSGAGFAIGGGSSIVNASYAGPSLSPSEDISWIKGAHQFGFGAGYMHLMINNKTGINATGVFTFNGSVTGLSLADFMVGGASSWAQGNFAEAYNRTHYLGLYAQDTWKATSRLTVSYGLRWEPFLPEFSKNNGYHHFDPSLFASNFHSSVYVNAPPGLIFPGDSQWPNGNSIANNRWNVFLPRLGVVFDPSGNGRMTIRAAVGRFADKPNLNMLTPFSQAAPVGNNITLNNVTLSNPWAAYPGGNPLPIIPSKTFIFPTYAGYITDPFDWRQPIIDQWNFSIQRQIASDWLLTANYIGNHTSHLVAAGELNAGQFLGLGPCTINGPNGPVNYSVCSTTANINQRRTYYLQNPLQGQYYAVIATLDDGGTANYNGLFLSAQKRLNKGTSVLANYTWSHCLSDVWNGFPGNTGQSSVTPGDRHHDHGNCATSDQRQVFNLSIVAPTPKFSNRALRLVAGDWQVSPIMKIKSAQFFTVTTGVDNALSGEGGQRPNLANLNPYPASQTVNNWILASAFAAPAPGTYGNLSPYNLKGPGMFQLDLALSRIFRVREKDSVQVRAEAFNLPNHLNPNIPVAATNSGAFGQIQTDISGTSGLTAGDQRIVQFALKYVF